MLKLYNKIFNRIFFGKLTTKQWIKLKGQKGVLGMDERVMTAERFNVRQTIMKNKIIRQWR